MFIPSVSTEDTVMYYPPLSDHSKVKLEDMGRECKVTRTKMNGVPGMIEVKYPVGDGTTFVRSWASYSETPGPGKWTKIVRPPQQTTVVTRLSQNQPAKVRVGDVVIQGMSVYADPQPGIQTTIGDRNIQSATNLPEKISIEIPEPAMTRQQLIAIAHDLAEDYAKRNGWVTSTIVWQLLAKSKIDCTGHDPRWMGAIFKTGKKWQKIGYTDTGSHGRPVAQWKLV